MGIHRCTVFVLLALCALLSTHGQPAEVRQRYMKFLTQHVYGTMSEQACDRIMHQRHITQFPTGNDCKEYNTFIRANDNEVRAVCMRGGTPLAGNRDLYMSTKPFSVVQCKLKKGERHPNCEYRGHKSTKKIVVACAGEWPTHYEEGIIV